MHHTDDLVKAHIDIHSNHIDLAELTGFSEEDSTGIDEQLDEFQLRPFIHFFSSCIY